ncbi:two-component regulator propeller domain-containing protein [Marinoscillum sp.]|uniref:hybrid sensor histidine kinase/response regulator transcription factor n=1 Tax=Marinoscillum sp. TaxID=2024838 RepID=UPI003BAA2EB7
MKGSVLILRMVVVLLLLAATINRATGQNRGTRFQHLTIDDGLPQNMVDCMLQDSQGFMWFGTWNGLCRYDGYQFEVFDDNQSLGNNFIYSMLEGPYGNLWIGTRQGLHTYRYDEDQFRKVLPQFSGGDRLHSDIRSMVLHRDSILLFGSEMGLVAYHIRDEGNLITPAKLFPFGSASGQIRGSVIHTVCSDTKGNIWLGTDAGISMIPADGSDMTYFEYEAGSLGLTSNQVLKIYEHSSGEIWVGTEFGLNKYVYSGVFEQFLNNESDPETLVHNTIMDISEDASGNLIIATLGGLSIMTRDMSFKNYKSEYNVDNSLNNDFVNCLLRDAAGNIWIGTERGGVNFFNTNQNTFEHFEYHMDDPNSLSQSTVNSVYEDTRYVWVGTAGGGLNRYEKSTGKFHHFRHDPEDPASISSDFVTSIHRDRDGNLWIGTWGFGLDILSEEHRNKNTFIHHQEVNHPGLVSNFISSITEDEKGNLWIGTLGGLTRYVTSAGRFETLYDQVPTKISGIGCLLFDDDQSLWVGTRNGLYHLDFPEEPDGQTVIKKYIHDPKNEVSLSGNYVISALRDAEGGLWFGTYGQGLNRVRKVADSITFEVFGTNEGLSNTIIYTILEDTDRNLWMSTDYGLSRLNPSTNKVRNFFIADGLLNNQYYWSAAHKNESGKLYFGGMKGLVAFYPDWIREEIHSTSVVITDIRLLNESVVPGQEYNGVLVLEEGPYQADAINLSYKEKIFGIEFSSLNYQEPEMIRYAYILEGFEQEWNYVRSNRRYASYTNLRPGSYTFKVKASGSDGEFSSEIRELSIHIAPPFWDTSWFRILCAMVLVGLIVGYIRLRTYSLKRQKLMLEAQVKERTEKIKHQNEALSKQAVLLQESNSSLEDKQKLIEGQNHKLEVQNKEILSQRDELITLNEKVKLVSQLKLSFFTNISHEFRTPLTLIIGPVEKLIKEHDFNADVKNTLAMVNRNAQRLLHLINQLMDFRKIEKGRMELKVTQGNVSEFCKNIFRAFHPLSEIKQVTFDYQEHDLPDEVWFDRGKLENILYNLLSNAFKYTPDGGKVKLEVKGMSFEDHRLGTRDHSAGQSKAVISIRVTDSGIGISEENLPLIFKRFYRIESEEALRVSGSGIGLALTEELIKTHHGDIFVESKLGSGSVFEVQFPCIKGAYEANEIADAPQEGMNIFQHVEVLKSELLVNDVSENENTHLSPVIKGAESTVLVVEDNADLRKFIVHRLEKTYHVLEAGDGAKGIEKADKFNPDIVISDVMMPKVDGLELLTTLKNNLSTSHIPVILLTAKSSIENQIQGLQIGADDYLAKPFNFELLEAKIQNFIESRKKLRHLFLQSADFKVNEATTSTRDQKFLEQAIQTVESHMKNSEFGVKEFVEKMSISRSLLHKKLTHLTNQSAAEFINHLRMKNARHLLRQNQMNISEVAYAVGYNDPKYFTRLFSKHFGQSPKEFLQEVAVNR